MKPILFINTYLEPNEISNVNDVLCMSLQSPYYVQNAHKEMRVINFPFP